MTSVGIYTYSTKPRGSVVHAAHLADALTDAGHDVTLYALGKDGDGFYRPVRAELCVIPAAPAPAGTDELIAQRIAELVAGIRDRDRDHDVHHAEDCLAGSALLEARELGLGCIVRTVHHVERYESPYLMECQRRSIEQADQVLSVSEATRREVLREYGREAEVVQSGVDVERFSRRRPDLVEAARQRFGIPEGDRVVLSVGGIEPRKNSLRALAAVAKAYVHHPELHWVVAGGASIWDHDPYRREFMAALSGLTHDLQSRIHLAGPVDDDTITGLQQLADVLLFPSTKEGWGLSVLEALAARTAVVVSAGEPFDEYLDPNAAVLVDPGSTDAIARAVVTLLRHSALRDGYAAVGVLRARRFTWERTAARHSAVYRDVVARVTGRV